MRIAHIRIEGLSPYSPSKSTDAEGVTKAKNESYLAFEQRTWKSKMHVDEKGRVYVPGAAFLKSMAAAASYLAKNGELKKKGQATFAENFRCGIMPSPRILLDQTPDDARPEAVLCDSEGKKRRTKTVTRIFPIFDKWSAAFDIHIFDEAIREEHFLQVLEACGMFIGVGRFRPENNGFFGRFRVVKCDIEEVN